MKALISPNEPVIGSDGVVLGHRVAQVAELSFDVAYPLYWIECSDDVIADHFYCVGTTIFPLPTSQSEPTAVK